MTYLYEIIPAREGDPVQQFELQQGAQEAPLSTHPETGERIRRVILGGWGLKPIKLGTAESASGDCGCGPSGCC